MKIEYWYRTKPQGFWFGPFLSYAELTTAARQKHHIVLEVDVRPAGEAPLTPDQEKKFDGEF
jgi:hypothetical protein